MMGEEGKERMRSVLVLSYTEREDMELLLLLTLSWRKVSRARRVAACTDVETSGGRAVFERLEGECAHKITCSQPPQRLVWGF